MCIKHLLWLKCTNHQLSVLLVPTGMEPTWNTASLISFFWLWCRAKRTFFTLRLQPGMWSLSPNHKTSATLHYASWIAGHSIVVWPELALRASKGWLTCVWGWLIETLSILNAPFGPQRWWVSPLATQWQDCRHRVDYRVLRFPCLPLHPKVKKHNYLETFPDERAAGIFFCLINHNLNVLLTELQRFKITESV